MAEVREQAVEVVKAGELRVRPGHQKLFGQEQVFGLGRIAHNSHLITPIFAIREDFVLYFRFKDAILYVMIFCNENVGCLNVIDSVTNNQNFYM